MIVTVCNEKGGAGKSSVAQSLAVHFLRQGKTVLLVDADPQKTTADWAQERNEGELPSISCVEMSGNIRAPLEEMRSRFDVVTVDCGGADSKAMRSALAISDMAILPFRPKRRDLKVAPEMAEIIETVQVFNNRLRVFSIITQAPTHPNQRYRIDNARKLLVDLGLNPLRSFTRNLNAWDDAEEAGCSVLEYQEDKKAAEDAIQVFDELFRGIHE
ncbi:gp46 [Sodalis phage phiSG1]|uniref:ParA-like partition protein n=1 Tax=Sodalis phage phiSG1 TaxID=373126 RepID=UPI00006C5C10|nr:ParA-like partition protein [Sodalis phage phiSG1]ABN42250.1 gp46 [Sodalis phage phiSG1]BAE80509.1 conserved hypothetical protein [Sodalis phage phiSG1]